ncbi:ribonuclease H-like domain-containing protein [Tanacetum coccineum]
MSSIGERTFFLGLQVQQKKDEIFISQDKYVGEILKKFGFPEVNTASTPMETQKPLLKDEDGEEVDVHIYRSMIGSLMYLTSSRPDIMFAVCVYARYQVNPKVSHLHAVKRIFSARNRQWLEIPQQKLNIWLLQVAVDKRFGFRINYLIIDLLTKAFDATIKAKTVNGEVQLQALVDGKKIIITDSIVRRDLQLENAEGVDCLPNATIFEQLTLMGYEKLSQKLTFYKAFFSPQWKFFNDIILQCLSSKTTAWNEFSSTMSSAIICLATNQKFNFSKYIFESKVKNLDNVFGIFLMYPRFVQVFVNQQLEGMPTHKRIYISPSHTKKIFGNIRKVGNGFFGRDTPLFQTMMVQDQEEMGEGSEIPTDPHYTPTIIQPSTSQPQKKQRSRRPKRKDTEVPQSSVPSNNVLDEVVNKEMDASLATPNEPSSPGTSSGGGPRRQETMRDTIAQTSVLALETIKTTQANEIACLKRKVKKLERRNKSRTHGLKRLYQIGLSRRVESSGDEEDLDEDASKQGRRIHDIDADEDIALVNDDNKMFDVGTLTGVEVFAEQVVAAKDVNLSVDEVTLAQALAALKSAKVQEKVLGIRGFYNSMLLVQEVKVNADLVSPVASASTGAEGPIPPKTAEQKLARKNELNAKSTLMLAIPEEHLLKFHACKDAKSFWEAIKNRFGGNKESKKMQKTILKQNYENFVALSQEGLDKTYDRSLPSAWNNIALIMRNKSDLDTLSMDDLYINLKVYESGSKANQVQSQILRISKDQASTTSYADDVMFSFFANQSNAPQFIKKTRRKIDLNDKETVSFNRKKVECYNYHRRGHFARECRSPRNKGNRNRDAPIRNAPVDTSTTNALVVQDRIGGYDWSFQAEEGLKNFALMAYTSQGSSSSDSEVNTCSKDCLKSYETLQKQYDQQRKALNKSNLEIIGYQMGLESLEARIVVHEKNETIYEEDIAFLKYDVQVKYISIKDLKNQLEEALKEKDDLKLKLEKFEESSKNLTK